MNAVTDEIVEAALTKWFGEPWMDGVPGDLDGVFDDMRAALTAALSIRQGGVKAWTVKDGQDSDELGASFDVMLPNGEWAGCIAVDPNDARDTIRAEWDAEQERLSAYASPAQELADKPSAVSVGEVEVYVPNADMHVRTTVADAIEDLDDMLRSGWDTKTEAHFVLAIQALKAAQEGK